jgi:Protein of unknown function (DUF2587)
MSNEQTMPATEVPATEVPATEVSATEVAATEVPATDEAAPLSPEVVERGELVPQAEQEADTTELITEPGKVMRIGSMVKQLLEEVRSGSLDLASRERLAEIYERSIVELADAMSPDLQEELHNLALPFTEGTVPSESELRVAKAQLVGWLEGLFHGIQATLFAQQLAARQQYEQMRQLPPGSTQGQRGPESPNDRPGTYL